MPTLSRADFRSDDDWQKVLDAHGEPTESIELARRWEFEKLKIIPQDFRRELIQFVVGSHDRSPGKSQDWAPVQVFAYRLHLPKSLRKPMSDWRGLPPRRWLLGTRPHAIGRFRIYQRARGSELGAKECQGTEGRAALGIYWTASKEH